MTPEEYREDLKRKLNTPEGKAFFEKWSGVLLDKYEREIASTRAIILDKAKACVCQNREQKYGAVENNFAMIADLWSVYLGFKITPVDAAMMMNLLKTARIKTGTFKEDSFIDACGYIACAAELAKGE